MNPTTPIPLRPKSPDVEIEEQIRQRAYQFYEGRGRADGNAMDDWLQAEEDVLGSREAKAATAP
jgi:hypothetical protein